MTKQGLIYIKFGKDAIKVSGSFSSTDEIAGTAVHYLCAHFGVHPEDIIAYAESELNAD